MAATARKYRGASLRSRLALTSNSLVRRLHDGADEPEQREEDPEDEHPPVALAERSQAEREQDDEVQEEAAKTDSPPHESSFVSRERVRFARRSANDIARGARSPA